MHMVASPACLLSADLSTLFGREIILSCLQHGFSDVSVYDTTCHQWLQSPNVCRRSNNVLELKAHFAKGGHRQEGATCHTEDRNDPEERC